MANNKVGIAAFSIFSCLVASGVVIAKNKAGMVSTPMKNLSLTLNGIMIGIEFLDLALSNDKKNARFTELPMLE